MNSHIKQFCHTNKKNCVINFFWQRMIYILKSI